jgi:uncharacterized membrane protein YidH (DUF202 family)
MDAFNTFLTKVEDQILTPLIAVIALAAMIYFVYGVVNFIRSGAGDPKKRAEGQQQMIWGIIGLAILFGASTLVTLIQHTVTGLSG